MALSTLFSLIDDITVLAKLTAHKAAGVVGDDIALSAERMIGLSPARELPVVFQVMKGALLNKIFLVPMALLLNHYLPWLLMPILFIGACYLALEGAEKCWVWIYHRFINKHPTENNKPHNKTGLASEKTLIRGAIRTDLVLSIEIILISLTIVINDPLIEQAIVLFIVAFGLTFFIYGLVAWIVKLDDLGYYLSKSKSTPVRSIGNVILSLAPLVLTFISVIGTIAMLYVAGSIISHTLSSIINIHLAIFTGNSLLNGLITSLIFMAIGGIVGGILLLVFTVIQAVFKSP